MIPTPLVGVMDAGEAWPRPYAASVVKHPDTIGLRTARMAPRGVPFGPVVARNDGVGVIDGANDKDGRRGEAMPRPNGWHRDQCTSCEAHG